ncbi:MAG TPA: BrxA/BrxB family bacilliredoxin [Longimicrobiales bacterium]|nr:BrxA/BrxB family bacilliredoxin [Longimicrobiales bacterium]
MQHRYPELMIAPMRADMTTLGAEELRTAEDVDRFMEAAADGTALLVVNSVCGCSAGSMRPGLRTALERARPSRIGTVFAGADLEATERVREIFAPFPPSSPFIGVFRDGELVGALQRIDIKGIPPEDVADALVRALEEATA